MPGASWAGRRTLQGEETLNPSWPWATAWSVAGPSRGATLGLPVLGEATGSHTPGPGECPAEGVSGKNHLVWRRSPGSGRGTWLRGRQGISEGGLPQGGHAEPTPAPYASCAHLFSPCLSHPGGGLLPTLQPGKARPGEKRSLVPPGSCPGLPEAYTAAAGGPFRLSGCLHPCGKNDQEPPRHTEPPSGPSWRSHPSFPKHRMSQWEHERRQISGRGGPRHPTTLSVLSPTLSEPGRCPPGLHNLLPAPSSPPWAARPRALQAVWGWEHLVVEGGLQLVPVCLLASVFSSTKWGSTQCLPQSTFGR